jgi:hypothetical protein
MILTNGKNSNLWLAAMMIQKYPTDILYHNILAEMSLSNGKFEEALMLFDDFIWTDERNKNIRAKEDILHRAFCVDCFKPIRGVRMKCVNASCRNSDRCYRCARVLVPDPQGHSRHPCNQHLRIQIPSSKRLEMVGLPRQIQNH